MIRRLLPIMLAFAALLAGPAMARLPHPPLFAIPRPAPQPPLAFAYHGWKVDAQPSRGAQPAAKTVAAMKTQIDIVEHAGLKPAALDLLRAVPIVVTAAKTGPARYDPRGVVVVPARSLSPKKAALLYALLHAYQDKLVSGGAANPEILGFLREARTSHDWPKDADMLQNAREYFAATATVYLYGEFTREPYSRATLRQTQPRYYQWLALQFDDGRARAWKGR